MSLPPVLILSRSDICRSLPMGDCINAVEGAFARLAEGRVLLPPVAHMAFPGGGFHVKSAAFTDEPCYTAVKVNGNYPGNPASHGLPTIQGAILLCDGRNGSLLAIMDSAEVTAIRTGAATGVAARCLAPRQASTAGIIGCGVQGRVQLRALLEVLPLQRVYAIDREPHKANRFASEMGPATGLEVVTADLSPEVTRQCQVIVTCTPALEPLLGLGHVAPGTFVAGVGADNGTKHELEPALLAAARVVADHLGQCVEMGDLHHAIGAGVMSAGDVAAELGAVVTGGAELNLSPDDIVVFDSTGVATQDVAAAGAVYERALSDGIGLRVNLA